MPPHETPPDGEDGKQPRPKSQPLYIKLYFDPAYTELARFIGYSGKPLAEAQEFVLELEKKYGREKVIEAGEAVSTCEGKLENLTVRLTAEAKRLAWQLLGPPPVKPAASSAAQMVAESPESKRSSRGKHAKKDIATGGAEMQRRGIEAPARGQELPDPKSSPAPVPTAQELSRVEKSAPSVLQQYREAKERHPGMLLLFRNVASSVMWP